MSLLTKTSTASVRLLALHGSGSNSNVSTLQLENLGLTGSEFEVVCTNGPIRADAPGPGIAALAGLVSNVWYTWLPKAGPSVGGDALPESTVLRNALCDAIRQVLSLVQERGPFDAIFGFSQGALIASLVNGLPQDEALQAALLERFGPSILPLIPQAAPFAAAIFACAAAPMPLAQLRKHAGLGLAPAAPVAPGFHSVHLIGRKDEFKPWSESFAMSMNSPDTQVYYLPDGHEINRLQRADAGLAACLRQCFEAARHAPRAEMAAPLPALAWQQSSQFSSRAVAGERQVTAVKLALETLPETITGMLAAQPAMAPLFRQARERDARVATTYGQMLAFCQPGGEGDLRRIGVKAGDVVAYLAPPGGSATAAVAFLSIAAQTCAVPFSPNMSESDARVALEQYGVRHIVLFEGVAAPGVRAAFEHYARSGSARIHHASAMGASTPGLFRYLNCLDGFEQERVLVNAADANCLLLRTSGTTSLPKVVPLRQRDLVLNAALLADGIGLNSIDVTYSVMPLDHIGGLSASILCSVAVGASITCDGSYNPQAMVQALADSNPRPTWYSAVPTIHNATCRYLQENRESYLTQNGEWHGHSLRLIRSGAAALKEPDRRVLESTFGCEVVATYSMSEQMPISQPPRSGSQWQQQAGAVGVPVAASMAVVDPLTLRALPYGVAGDVAISGPTVFAGYLDNPAANQQSRFLLHSPADGQLHTWFLTGDLGEMGPDGTLTLRGRIKELIKRGGEQIAPPEVEDLLVQHPWVSTAICFPVPSDTYGEEVGCALVLKPAFVGKVTQQEAMREMRDFLRKKDLASYKFPTAWKLVADDDLPKTASRKYIRNGLAEVLGLPNRANDKPTAKSATQSATQSGAAKEASLAMQARCAMVSDKPLVDWATLSGLRFLLACYVMFMHIGSDASWGAVANLRQFPWHVPTFFALAGFTLAASMPSLITRKWSFIWARIAGMYPLYGLALVISIIHLTVSCQPSTFSSVFHWIGQANGGERLFCEGTPLLQTSWWSNFFSTIAVYATGLQATPLWGASWFMGFYLWFISMYFQCIIVFPLLYNMLYKNRGNTRRLLMVTALGLALNVVILLGFWYGYAVDATGYGFFDQVTGLQTTPTAAQLAKAGTDNATILGFYLFAPFWMVYFVVGMCAAFVYDAVRPAEQVRAHIWGYVADAITVFLIVMSVAHVAQGYFQDTLSTVQPFALRPAAADTIADVAVVNRIWDDIYSRMFAPITMLWIFALSTGKGVTASILRSNPIAQTLAPTAFACFLFHQIVGQWYFAITRHGQWWNWWTHRKAFYWFSPQPVPVEWYEYFYVVGLVVIFAKAMQTLEPGIRQGFVALIERLKGTTNEQPIKDSTTGVLQIIHRVTGLEAEPEWSLVDCGLASLGIVQFTNTLQNEFSGSGQKISLAVADVLAAPDIRAIAALVDAAKLEAQASAGQLQAV